MLHDKKEIAKRRRTRSGGNTVPFPVYIDDWECDILPGRRFKIRPRGAAGWMYICDVGAFFQRSFLSAIDPSEWSHPIVSDEDFALIAKGKERRSSAHLDDEMIAYNLAENRALAALMRVLNRGFVANNIRLKRDQWFGPGQAAQAWMNNVHCPTGEEVRAVTPKWVLSAARSTYYGGWFEIFCHGHIPGVSYEYDEISSYPYTISMLPCLLHGTWKRGVWPATPTPAPSSTPRMVFADVQGSDPRIGAVLHRTPRGTICRPHHSRGWFWQHELDAATAAGLIDTINVHEWIEYQPCDCAPPLSGIRDLFEERKRVGKNTPHGKGLKLVYNSVYGKCAQSIGQPKYANPIWASLITSWTRTRILQAIATHPKKSEDVLMVATDGVYFSSPHPGLEISDDELGKWEAHDKHNLTLFMPGMYWDDITRDRLKDGKAPKLKSRGVSAKALAEKITEIDAAFNDIANAQQWPQCVLNLNFYMISPAQAIQRNNWSLAGHVIYSTPPHPGQECSPECSHVVRVISSDPVTKRCPDPYMQDGIMRTVPYPEAPIGPIESMPYDGSFGETVEYILTDEMDIDSIVAEMLT